MPDNYSLSKKALSDITNFHQYLIDENVTNVFKDFITGIFQKFHLLALFP